MSELSPAALTVWSAFLDRYEWEVTTEELFAVAAALRAVADQVEPDDGVSVEVRQVLRRILAIATELEAQ